MTPNKGIMGRTADSALLSSAKYPEERRKGGRAGERWREKQKLMNTKTRVMRDDKSRKEG